MGYSYLEAKDKVAKYAKKIFSTIEIDDDGDLRIPFDDGLVLILVRDRSEEMDQQDKAGEGNSWDQRVLVIITSPILIELEPTPDLYKWIATEGQNNLYGSFGLNEDLNELFFRYVISGDNIEETCLQNALVEVVRNAIVAPEELQSKFGGTRVCEL